MMADIVPQFTIPAIASDQIRLYCETVFGYLDGFVPIRIFSEKGTSHKNPITPFCPIEQAAVRLIEMAPSAASKSMGVYVIPGTVCKPGGAKAEDMFQTGVVVVDLDNGDVPAKRDWLVRHIGPASLEVASGGKTDAGAMKLHLYWRLTEAAEGADLETVANARRAILEKAGGDTSFASMHQPIRVAGTVHGKHGRPAPVSIVSRTKREYDLAELSALAHAMPPFPNLKSVTNTVISPTAASLATMHIREGGIDGVTRFDALSKVIGHWIRNIRRNQCSLGEAWTAVQEYNQACIAPPWDVTSLRKEFDALLRKDIATQGAFPAISSSDRENGGARSPEFSEDALSDQFVTRLGAHWRHVPFWRKWFRWTGTVWTADERHLVREDIRQVCRAAAAMVENANMAHKIASERTITAVQKISASDPRISTGQVRQGGGKSEMA